MDPLLLLLVVELDHMGEHIAVLRLGPWGLARHCCHAALHVGEVLAFFRGDLTTSEHTSDTG